MKHHNVSDLSKHSPRPDQRGDGTAKLRELEKVKRVREQQLRAAQKNLKEVEEKAMQETTETTSEKTRSYTQKKLAPVELEAIERLVSTQGEQRVVSWLSGTPRAQLAQNPMSWARGALRSIRDPEAAHKSTLLDVAAELLTNFGKHHNGQRVEATPIPVEVTEVRSVVENRATPVSPEPTQVPVNDPDSGVFEANRTIEETPNVSIPSTIDFNGRSVRMVVDGDAARFISKDLVEAVGAVWKGPQAIEHIPADFKGATLVVTPGGPQQMSCLSEAGMNMYLFRSDKPAALPWQRHLAEIVLPQIRKTGTYTAPGAAMQLAQPAIDRDLLATLNSQAKALSDVIARDLLREQNEAERLKAQSGWAERKPKPKTENPDQVNFVVEQEASEIHGKAQKVTGLRQKRCTTELDRDTAASGVYRELRAELAKLGHMVPGESDEKQNHYIARNGWTTEACAILAVIYDREKKLAADLKRSTGQRT